MLGQAELAALQTLDDFEALAKTHLTHRAYEFVAGAVGDEVTAAENRAAFRRTRLEPRVLVDVSRTDTSVTLFGRRHEHPILLAPTGYHKLFHVDGETATVHGADLAEATLIAAVFATTSIEEMAALAHQPLWFQLYIHRDRGVTRELVESGHGSGLRSDLRNRGRAVQWTPRPGIACWIPAAARSATGQLSSGWKAAWQLLLTGHLAGASTRRCGLPSATWADLEWLRSHDQKHLY